MDSFFYSYLEVYGLDGCLADIDFNRWFKWNWMLIDAIFWAWMNYKLNWILNDFMEKVFGLIDYVFLAPSM